MSSNLVLFGPPGAGKGTQAKRMEVEFGVPQISTGDMLRAARHSGTAVGEEAKSYMDAGKLVPDAVVIKIIEERIEHDDCRAGFLMDGFPRTVAQAEALDGMLQRAGKGIDAVVSIEVDDREIVNRLGGRRVCKGCGGTYHVVFNPTAEDGVCDACGGETYLREDDQAGTVRARLNTYHEQTAPVAGYYEDQGLLRPVSGVGSIDEIFESVKVAVRG